MSPKQAPLPTPHTVSESLEILRTSRDPSDDHINSNNANNNSTSNNLHAHTNSSPLSFTPPHYNNHIDVGMKREKSFQEEYQANRVHRKANRGTQSSCF